jgi:hypothetical protein
MVEKYSNIFLSKALQNWPQVGLKINHLATLLKALHTIFGQMTERLYMKGLKLTNVIYYRSYNNQGTVTFGQFCKKVAFGFLRLVVVKLKMSRSNASSPLTWALTTRLYIHTYICNIWLVEKFQGYLQMVKVNFVTQNYKSTWRGGPSSGPNPTTSEFTTKPPAL